DEPDVMWKQYGASAGDYADLDLFNRVTSSRWTKDLASDKDFYDVDVTYDRNSNPTLVNDNVHAGFDVSYAIDNLDRVVTADEGTWSGSITSRTRKQEWTLTHTGNWGREKLDLNGDGAWGGTNEHDDTRTHTVANEIATRDLDSNSGTGGKNYTLTHDLDGNLTEDGVSYKYEYDACGRLRKIKNRSNAALVAEYTYNGLGWRTGWHEDTDTDGDVDSNDVWYYQAYDERWRMLAVYRSSDANPKEEFVNHEAGLDGRGASSYIDAVICRNFDRSSVFTDASDGV